MENIQITKKELVELVDSAVVNAVKDINEKNEKKSVPTFIFKDNNSKQSNVIGAYANTLIMAAKSGFKGEEISKETLIKFAEKNLNKTKTLGAEMFYKGLNETNDEDGGYLIVPEVYNQFIEELTASNVIRSLPITNYKMNGSQLEVNRADTGAGAFWTGENPGSEATKSNPKFGKYILTPKNLLSWATISNDLINDSAVNVEKILQDMIIRAAGNAEEIAFITGVGSSYSPKGLYGWTKSANINTSSGTTAELIESDIFELEELILGSNVKSNNLTFLMNFKAYSTLRTKLRVTTNVIAFPELREKDLYLMGHKVVITNNIPTVSNKTNIYLFAPEHFIIADRQNLSFSVNPPQNDSNFPQGINETLIVANSRVDTLLKYDTACAIIKDFAV